MLCGCGCGGETKIYRGFSRKYIRGHWAKLKDKDWIKKLSDSQKGDNNGFYGKHHSEKTKLKISSSNLGRKDSIKTRTQKSSSKLGKKNSFYGKKHSKETKIKISDNHIDVAGKNNPAWKGGITPLYNQIRKLKLYKEWEHQIKERDNFICQWCGIRGGKLESHHIKGFSEIIKDNNIKTKEEVYMCQELWNLNNGITLCKECHMKTNNYKNRKVI